jgi:hypothetical protein
MGVRWDSLYFAVYAISWNAVQFRVEYVLLDSYRDNICSLPKGEQLAKI